MADHQKAASRSGASRAVLGLALAWSGHAAAQDAAPPAAQSLPSSATTDADEDAIKDIIVTGTNISGVKAVGSEAISLKREDILATGQQSVADVLKTLPQVQNIAGSFSSASSGGAGNSNSGSNATRGTAINFRGVGQGATLTLVDGHRISPAGSATAYTEANQVPLAALERVEVIADGASAIYGSDAISGVINYVLRKDFNGIELGGRYTAGNYDNDEYALSAVAGTHWHTAMGDGSILVTYEYGFRDPFVRGKNPRLRQDERPYGGQDNRVVGNAATVPINGNIVVSGTATNTAYPQGGTYTYYALPLNPNGLPLTPGDLVANNPNLVDRSDYEDYMSRQKRHQAAAFLRQELSSKVQVYDEFFFTRTEQSTRTFYSQNQASNVTVTVQPTSPFYIHGVPGTVAPPFPGAPFSIEQPETVQLNLLARVSPNGPRFVNLNPDTSFNNTVGLKAELFAGWHGDAYYTYGQDRSCGVCYLGNYISADTGATDAFFQPIIGQQNALQNAVDAGLINPFSTAPFTKSQLDLIVGSNSQYSQNYSHDAVAKIDGPLFGLPAGSVRAAIGGEFYHGLQKLQNGANRPPNNGPIFTPDANASTTRTQYAGFAEVYVPVVGDEMNVPLMRSLTLSGAVRYDHYSDFGSTTNPKVSATWQVDEDLQFRGSWGTSFRAPGLPELNGGVFSVAIGYNLQPIGAGVTDIPTPAGGGNPNLLLYVGGNPNLKAERGTNWQLGGDYKPHYLPGLTLTGTYYNILYRNKLGSTGAGFNAITTPALEALYRPYVIPINNPATCNANDPSTLDPALRPFASFLYAATVGFNPRNLCAINAVIDSRFSSIGHTSQDGIDASVNYITGSHIGTFNFNVGISKILHDTQTSVAGQPAISVLDTVGNPISLRGRGNITYAIGPFSATLFGNYTGGYTNNQPITIQNVAQPITHIKSWTTFDLSLALNFPRDGRWEFMRGTRLGVTITNLFDKAPPIVNSTYFGSSSIDLSAANPYGRYMQLSLTKSF